MQYTKPQFALKMRREPFARDLATSPSGVFNPEELRPNSSPELVHPAQ
jgi:hypothetical protein